MATETTETVIPKGFKVLQNLGIIFPNFKSPDEAVRKGTFRIKLVNGIMSDDGKYRDAIRGIDDSPVTMLENVKPLLEDEITLKSGKTLTGYEVSEALSIYADNIWAKKYDKETELP